MSQWNGLRFKVKGKQHFKQNRRISNTSLVLMTSLQGVCRLLRLSYELGVELGAESVFLSMIYSMFLWSLQRLYF
jgi:hypothetical protein